VESGGKCGIAGVFGGILVENSSGSVAKPGDFGWREWTKILEARNPHGTECHRESLEGLKRREVSSGIPEVPATLNGVQCHSWVLL